MDNKEIDKQIEYNKNFLIETDCFVKESEGIIKEYWIKGKRGKYMVEVEGNVVDVTLEIINRVGYIEYGQKDNVIWVEKNETKNS